MQGVIVNYLSSLGEVLSPTKGVPNFRFTGRVGAVRKVPRKPARMGIGHYHLPSGCYSTKWRSLSCSL